MRCTWPRTGPGTAMTAGRSAGSTAVRGARSGQASGHAQYARQRYELIRATGHWLRPSTCRWPSTIRTTPPPSTTRNAIASATASRHQTPTLRSTTLHPLLRWTLPPPRTRLPQGGRSHDLNTEVQLAVATWKRLQETMVTAAVAKLQDRCV